MLSAKSSPFRRLYGHFRRKVDGVGRLSSPHRTLHLIFPPKLNGAGRLSSPHRRLYGHFRPEVDGLGRLKLNPKTTANRNVVLNNIFRVRAFQFTASCILRRHTVKSFYDCTSKSILCDINKLNRRH